MVCGRSWWLLTHSSRRNRVWSDRLPRRRPSAGRSLRRAGPASRAAALEHASAARHRAAVTGNFRRRLPSALPSRPAFLRADHRLCPAGDQLCGLCPALGRRRARAGTAAIMAALETSGHMESTCFITRSFTLSRGSAGGYRILFDMPLVLLRVDRALNPRTAFAVAGVNYIFFEKRSLALKDRFAPVSGETAAERRNLQPALPLANS